MYRKTPIRISNRRDRHYPKDRIVAAHFFERYPHKLGADQGWVRPHEESDHELALKYQQWGLAMKSYFRAICMELADGRDYTFPTKRLGTICIRKYRTGIQRARSLRKDGRKTTLYRYGYYVYLTGTSFKFSRFWAFRLAPSAKAVIREHLKANPDGIFKIKDAAKYTSSWSYEEKAQLRKPKKLTQNKKRCKITYR